MIAIILTLINVLIAGVSYYRLGRQSMFDFEIVVFEKTKLVLQNYNQQPAKQAERIRGEGGTQMKLRQAKKLLKAYNCLDGADKW